MKALLAILVGILLAGCWREHAAVRKLEAMSLMPGYTLTHRQGDDTYVGEIKREDGIRIGIDIGGMSGLWANPAEPQKHDWIQTIKRPDGDVYVGMRSKGMERKRMLCVTFPDGIVNFFGYVNSEEEVATFLMMVLTYK
jgi:hypothetical protein